MNTCGQCSIKFETLDNYLNHICNSGFTPKDQDHLGDIFKKISENSLKRGKARKVKK